MIESLLQGGGRREGGGGCTWLPDLIIQTYKN